MARKVLGALCLRNVGVQIFPGVTLAGRLYTMAPADAKAAVACGGLPR